MKFFAVFAAVSGFLAVALGAFGAHGLQDSISARYMQVWQTAAQYQIFHTLIILLIACVGLMGLKNNWLFAALIFFAFGILLFSGSLYLLVLSGKGWLGIVTPIGGTLFLLGWLSLALGLISVVEV